MNLAKGTRVRLIKPLRKSDEIGDIYTVKNADDTSITVIRSREYDIENFLNVTFGIGVTGYCVSQQEFAEHFEVIGMEKTEKKSDDEAIIGDYTETELDELWNAANYSYEDFKKMLKRSVKWCDKDQKKQREWAGPHHEVMSGVEYYISKPNNKSWKIKVCNDGYVGIASCRPDDHFVISTGVKLAAARARRKKAKAEHLAALKKIEETREEMMDAIKCENLIIGKIYHGGEK